MMLRYGMALDDVPDKKEKESNDINPGRINKRRWGHEFRGS
jgi:hypothetical protein